MKLIILLSLIGGPLYFPFDDRLSCYEQGYELMTSIAKYQGPGPEQGWYTDRGDLIYGFYCE